MSLQLSLTSQLLEVWVQRFNPFLQQDPAQNVSACMV